MAAGDHETVQQDDRHLVAVAALVIGVGVHVATGDPDTVLVRPWQEYREQFIAQRTVFAADVIELEHGQRTLCEAVSTAAATCRTVSGGTSPMAVTRWPPTSTDMA